MHSGSFLMWVRCSKSIEIEQIVGSAGAGVSKSNWASQDVARQSAVATANFANIGIFTSFVGYWRAGDGTACDRDGRALA